MKRDERESAIPSLDAAEFELRLRSAAPGLELERTAIAALHAHFVELRRWDRSAGLIGPGTRSAIVERHYAESLAAVPYLGRIEGQRLVDLGSGGGFPGLVLAVVRPSLEVTLVESRERKAAFLEWAAQRAGARCRVVRARIVFPLPPELPDEIEFVTLRAISLERRVWDALVERLVPEGRILHWVGPRQAPPLLASDAGFEIEADVPLPDGGEGRRLCVLSRRRRRG